ncbi:hypothetical protein MWU50_05260 [Flavobacteriaceae bacterium S0862]|nr:hypothetical protein [Flavobacteriaceae bacterium S0862]
MKKTVFIILLGFITIYASAQGIDSELNLGFTTGDLKDELGLEVNTKVAYLWEVTPRYSLGPLVGLSWIFSKEESGGAILDDSFGYTISAANRYDLSDFFIGADLGYGGVSAGGGSSGFYYRPVIGFMIGERYTIVASYASLNLDKKEGGTWTQIGFDKGNTLETFQIGVRLSN